eukprot:jgi/Chlat1/3996/Chrsp26S03985
MTNGMLHGAYVDSYTLEHARKKTKAPPTCFDPARLLTDRAAYIAYLEAQMDRLARACERHSGDAQAHAQLDERVSGLARVVKVAQSYAEECERTHSKALASIHRRIKHLENESISQLDGAQRGEFDRRVEEALTAALDRTLDETSAGEAEAEKANQSRPWHALDRKLVDLVDRAVRNALPQHVQAVQQHAEEEAAKSQQREREQQDERLRALEERLSERIERATEGTAATVYKESMERVEQMDEALESVRRHSAEMQRSVECLHMLEQMQEQTAQQLQTLAEEQSELRARVTDSRGHHHQRAKKEGFYHTSRHTQRFQQDGAQRRSELTSSVCVPEGGARGPEASPSLQLDRLARLVERVQNQLASQAAAVQQIENGFSKFQSVVSARKDGADGFHDFSRNALDGLEQRLRSAIGGVEREVKLQRKRTDIFQDCFEDLTARVTQLDAANRRPASARVRIRVPTARSPTVSSALRAKTPAVYLSEMDAHCFSSSPPRPRSAGPKDRGKAQYEERKARLKEVCGV